jgi:hypothetical protein
MRFRTGTPYEALGCLPSLQHNTPFCSEISSEIKLVFNHSLVSNRVTGFKSCGWFSACEFRFFSVTRIRYTESYLYEAVSQPTRSCLPSFTSGSCST